MMAEMYKKRMGSLVEAGLSEEDADITTKQFESLSDEQFESIVATLSKVSTQNLESAEEPIAETAESSDLALKKLQKKLQIAKKALPKHQKFLMKLKLKKK
jgi:hypothetical protein